MRRAHLVSRVGPTAVLLHKQHINFTPERAEAIAELCTSAEETPLGRRPGRMNAPGPHVPEAFACRSASRRSSFADVQLPRPFHWQLVARLPIRHSEGMRGRERDERGLRTE